MNLKKIIFIILIGLGILSGCAPKDKPVGGESNIEDINAWVKETVPTETFDDLELPLTHPELGGNIVWSSTDQTIISDAGEITLEKGSADAILNYTITLDDQNKSDFLVIKVYSLTLDEVAQKFEQQFAGAIARDYNVKTDFDGYKVSWTSSNPNLFSNEGKYNKPSNDTLITINYEVAINNHKETYQFEIIVKGLLVSEKRAIIVDWINDEYLPSKLITEEIQLPTYNEQFEAPIHWESSNPNVISSDGKVTRYPFDRYVSIRGVARVQDVDIDFTISVIVAAENVSSKQEKINAFLDAIALKEIGKLTFASYANINQTYNFLPFYENVPAPVVQQIMPKNSERPEGVEGSRPGTKMTSVEFITIHDTASTSSGATAKMHADLLVRGYTASWHFAVDEDGAYQSIPLDEIAWHAGDGTRYFGLTDTGVKASGPYPEISISEDGYFTINGEKSTVKAPTSGGRILKGSDITPSGIYTEVGENGNYYINNTYYNTDYGKISNHGGNRNSIGIESCVNNGSNYQMTVRHLAKLVAELLIMNDLGVERVLQHNNFSGKPCPNSIRNTGYWDNFLDLVSLEKFAKEELEDVEFVWTSQTPILDNHGMISLNVGNTRELKYAVVVSFDGTQITRSFTTKLIVKE